MKEKKIISRPGRASRSGSGDPSADPKKGAILLIAVLVTSVALAVGIGVYNRVYKELLFASYWKQTQIAFAAADAGLECALYWELHPGAGGVGTASCFGLTIASWNPLTAGSFNLMTPGGGCVNITITAPGGVSTSTEARGYNDACGSTNPRRVERGLRITY